MREQRSLGVKLMTNLHLVLSLGMMKVPYFRAQVKLSVWLFDSRWQLIIF